ncbi:MAG: TonB-dependent receptor [Bernardetiaceae bacterium]|jgi:iron complex outermembrane receptor protein|nr:TonB-dependent receptor [Bernardetiaceae bacterium]
MRTFTTLRLLVILLAWPARPVLAQTSQIKGKVTDQAGQGLPYANLVIKGTTKGTATDQTGRFVLRQVPAGAHQLVVTCVGYRSLEYSVTVATGQTPAEVTIALAEDSNTLNEVVVRDLKLEEYVVEAPSASLRINTPLMETPQNIAVVTTQTIKDFGLVGTAEMARLTSGVVKRYGGANDFAFTIRGTDATNNNFRNGVGNYWWNQQADAFMIERVEFVKGPTGFMIGNAEPGGLLNEVTKQPDGTRVREAQVGHGTFGLWRGGVDVGGQARPNSRWSYRLVTGGQRQLGLADFYTAHRTYWLPSVRYTYRPGSHVQVEWIRMDGRSRAEGANNFSYNGQDFLLPLRFNAVDPNVVRGIETDDNYLRLSHQHQLGRGWQLKTQLADVRGLYRGDGMFVSTPSVQFDTLYRSYYYINWRNRLAAAQTFVDGTFYTGRSFKHSVLVGLDYGRSQVKSQFGDLNDPDPWGDQLPILTRNPVYNLTPEQVQDTTMYPEDDWGTRWLALYAQDHLKIADRLVVTVAGRLSHTKAWASFDSASVYNTRFTPRFGLTYLFNRNLSAYGLYDQTFLPQTGRKEDRTAARPLTGSNLEFGVKSQWLGQQLSINATWFRTVKNNVLVQNPQTTLYVERGQITSQGFELDVMGSPTPNLVVNANYAYTDARITQDADSALVGFPNFGLARHVANAMVRYRFLAGALEGFSVGLGAQTLSGRSVVWPGWSAPEDRDRTAPGYTILDANVAYKTPRFAARLNVYNLTNRLYHDSSWWNSATDTQPGFFAASPGWPINLRLAVEYRF